MIVGEIWRRLTLFLRRGQRQRELAEEMEQHVAMKAAAYEQSGLGPDEAQHAARREFGNELSLRDRSRDMWGFRWLEALLQDIRFGTRMLRRSPGFAIVAVLTLALGIGANTAIFSVTYDILLKPLPYRDSSRLVQLSPGRPTSFMSYLSMHDFQEIASQTRDLVRWDGYIEGQGTILSPGGADGVMISFVSGDFFSVLGAKPMLGRPILPADAQPGHRHVAVLSYGLWQKRYGGDPHIVGKEIEITDEGEAGNFVRKAAPVRLCTVIGVMPPQLTFPNRDLYMPQGSWKHQVQLIAIGRMKQGTSIQTVNAAINTIGARLVTGAAARHKGPFFSVALLRDRLVKGYGTELVVLLGAVSFVLLLACANASGLLIARSWVRQQEVGVREALGATRWRLIRQFVAEGSLLALLGAAAGLFLTYWAVQLLRGMAPPDTPRLVELGINWVALGYTLGISALAAILFGLAPAMQLTRRGPSQALKQSSYTTFAKFHFHRAWRPKNVLSVTEIALACMLVASSSLVLHSFWNLVNVRLGFRPAHLLTMWVDTSPAIRKNPKAFEASKEAELRRVRALPGVEDAAFSMWAPLADSPFEGSIAVGGKTGSGPLLFQNVSPDFFRTMGIPLLRGRSFNKDDRAGSRPVAIVNEAFARRYLNGDPIGKRFANGFYGKPVDLVVVGEVGDARDSNLATTPEPEYYQASSQVGWRVGALFVRTRVNPKAMWKAIREQVAAVDPNAPVSDGETMDQVISESVGMQRFIALLLGAFGGLALLLAVAGVYGLISYGVARRTHEMGLRMALGAQRTDILRMVLREGMLLAAVGIVLGIGGALAVTRVLRSMLFEIKPNDPVTFVGVAFALALAALVACWIPARRAMKVDPVEALRYE